MAEVLAFVYSVEGEIRYRHKKICYGRTVHYQYIPYIWPLMASSVITLSLGIYALTRRRNVKGTISFMLCMIVVTLWSSANALEMSSIVFSTKLSGLMFNI